MIPHTCDLLKPCALCRRGMGSLRTATTPAPRPLPCVHLGADTGRRETCQTCAGKVELKVLGCRVYGGCTPTTPIEGLACCGSCGSYTPAGDPKYLYRPVPPPDLSGRQRDRCVVTLAVGEGGQALHRETRDGQRRYAERIGADYRVIADASQGWPLNEKWRYRGYVRAYPDGTLCIDADIAVSPTAPDLFALVPADKVGVSVAPSPPASFAPKLAAVCRSQGVPVPPGAAATHWNSGLVVLRPPHADYWLPPALPLTGDWLDEEMWSKVTVHRNGWPVWDIPRSIHWQWWVDREFAAWERGRPPFAHLAGLGQVPISPEQHRVAMLRALRAG